MEQLVGDMDKQKIIEVNLKNILDMDNHKIVEGDFNFDVDMEIISNTSDVFLGQSFIPSVGE